jgi:FdhE protein
MNMDVEAIIRQRPYLRDPFRIYERVTKFIAAVREFSPGVDLASPDHRAYAPVFIDSVFGRFSTIFGLPEGSLSPLKQAMELGDIDFTRLPYQEVPAFSLPYPEEDLAMILFLVSRPYFLALGEAARLDGKSWDQGKCAVCDARPSLASDGPDSRRQAHCSFCGAAGGCRAAACPVCLNDEASRMHVITVEGEDSFRIHACDACSSYVKIVRAGGLSGMTPDIADLMSLPLDVIAQKRRYARRSPNPIGMIRMM